MQKRKAIIDLVSVIFFIIILLSTYKILEYFLIDILIKYEIFLIATIIGMFLDIFFDKVLQIIEEKIYIRKNENIHLFEFEYYREIIEKYPVSTLSLCLNRKTNYKDEMVATLIALEKENKIKWEKEKIIELKDNYSISEKNLIRFINGNEVYANKTKKYWYEDAIEEAKNNKLIITDKNYYPLISRIIGIIYLVIWIANFIYIANHEFSIITFGWVFVSFFVIMLNPFLLDKAIPFYRTREGIELMAKLQGLKRYLMNYSSINDRNFEEIKLWDYYIIYAIIFDIKGTLDKETKKYYEVKLKKLFK